MSKNFQKNLNSLTKLRLSRDEKRRVLHNVLGEESLAPSPFWGFCWRHGVVSVTLVVLVLGTGVSLASERSLPGDWLYPVKLNVNENLVSRLKQSDASRAAWVAELVVRRVHEAQQLAARDRLDSAKREQLEHNFDDYFEEYEQLSFPVSNLGVGVGALESTAKSAVVNKVDVNSKVTPELIKISDDKSEKSTELRDEQLRERAMEVSQSDPHESESKREKDGELVAKEKLNRMREALDDQSDQVGHNNEELKKLEDKVRERLHDLEERSTGRWSR